MLHINTHCKHLLEQYILAANNKTLIANFWPVQQRTLRPSDVHYPTEASTKIERQEQKKANIWKRHYIILIIIFPDNCESDLTFSLYNNYIE